MVWHYLHNSGSVWTNIKSLDTNLKETLWTLPRLLEKPSTAACWRDWKWVCGTFLEVYLLGFVCVSCSECVCRTQEERREEDPLNNAVLLSASGCVRLWLVPWTALLAVAHCTCTYCWRGRERRERERGEGGAVRRSQARQTVCVSVWTHTEQLLSSISPCTGPIFSFLISLRQRSRRQADLSGWCKWSVNKTWWHWWNWTAPRWVKVCECVDQTLLLAATTKNTVLAHFIWLKTAAIVNTMKTKSLSASEGEQRWTRHTLNTQHPNDQTSPKYIEILHHLMMLSMAEK